MCCWTAYWWYILACAGKHNGGQHNGPCVRHPFKLLKIFCNWFKHILFRRKGLGAAYNATMPSPEEVFTKEPNHTHTLPRIGCLIIPNVTITRQYDSQVNITNYNLPVSSINLCTASKTFLLISIPRSADPYSNNSHEISVIVSSLILFNNIFLAW